ncbi:hypothetical protein CEP51_005898 [Fusarium floridanum]|uniref:Uncharacterized protein n=1 Tax=Fusarium floridanum TaxID=1325733 RepID=A0A428RUY5_9HYPO|nr:hypothetical protein CEP51_005898 [Fusarium floridanum]
MITTTHEDDISTSWQGHCPGSVFAAAIINTLTSTSSPLLDGETAGTEEESLQPEEPTSEQEETYDEFCRSILNVCKNGPFEERAIADTCPSNKAFIGAPQLSGLMKISGGTFFIDEMTGSICQKRVSPMAELSLQTCPGDECSGWGPMVRNTLRSSTEKTLPQDELEEVAGLISFRWELGLLADYLVEIFGLPQPGGKICVLWNSQPWYSEAIKYPLHGIIFNRLVRGGFLPTPAVNQGPPFDRFLHYMAAAVALKDLPEPCTNQLVDQLVLFMAEARKFQEQRVVSDQNTLEKAQRWFKAIGRRMKSS